MKNKKGNVDAIKGFPAVVIGLFIVIVSLVLITQVGDSFTNNARNDASRLNNNESLTWAGNNTAINLLQLGVVPGSAAVYNNGVVVNEGSGTVNYTIDYTGGRITFLNVSTVTYLTNTLNITYSYYIGSYARNITRTGSTAVNTMNSYIPTVSLITAAGLIIGIVLMMFRRKSH